MKLQFAVFLNCLTNKATNTHDENMDLGAGTDGVLAFGSHPIGPSRVLPSLVKWPDVN